MKRSIPFDNIMWIIFGIILLLRLLISFSTDNFTYDSYFNIRQVEQIKETGFPVFNDSLSHGGRTLFFSPAFHYIFALFSLIVPIGITAKIIPNILYAALIPISYYLALQVTENKSASIFSSLFVAFMPALWLTVNSFNALCIIIPAIFYAIYCLTRINEKSYLKIFIATTIISAAISPMMLIILPALWLFLLLLKIEKIEERQVVTESIIFSTFIIILIQFLIYKKALLMHGSAVIWRNLPDAILNNFFTRITILNIIVSIGILAFIFGIYEIYEFSFTKKEREISAVISLAIVAGILLWAKMIEINAGMAILGVSLAIISSRTVSSMQEYFEKVKINFSFKPAATAIVIILAITTIPASFGSLNSAKENIPSNAEMNAMLWLRENSSEMSAIASSVEEGFLVNAVAMRKNILDSNFVMEPNSEMRYNDLKEIYTTNYETDAVRLLNKYRAKYVIISDSSKKEFGVSDLSYAYSNCFKKFYENDEIAIYKTWCDVE